MGDIAAELEAERDPRERLLLAGALLLLEQGPSVLEAGLSPDHITRRASRSRRTFYDHFGSKHGYLLALYDRFAAQPEPLVAHGGGLSAEAVVGPAQIVSHIRDYWGAFIEGYSSSADRLVQLIILLLAHDEGGVAQSIKAELARAETDGVERMQRMSEGWFVQMRPPWTPERYSRLLRALSDGFTLQRRVDGDEFDSSIFVDTVLSLFASIIYVEGEQPASVAEMVHELGAESVLRWQERVEPQPFADARDRVHQALLTELDARRFADITIEHIAGTSGVGRETIRRSFGGKEDLLAAMMGDYFLGIDSALELDMANPDLAPSAVLDRHIERIAELLALSRGMAGATAIALVEDTDGVVFHRSREGIEITARAVAGCFDPKVERELTAEEVAEALVSSLFSEARKVDGIAACDRTKRLARQLIR